MSKAPRRLRPDDFKRLPWRSIGPAIMGGRVSDLCFAPGNAKTFYVAYATGGIWKTTNLGTTFAPIFDDQATSSIGSIQVVDAPGDWRGWTADEKKGKSKKELAEAGKGKIVWVGTGEGNGRNSSSWGHGVYRSTDAGESWQHLGLEDSHDIPRLAVDPRDPDVCYVAALGHLWGYNKTRGVYKTTDGGKTWKPVLQIDDQTGCCDVILDPNEPDTVYAAMYSRLRTPYSFRSGGPEGGIYRSKDGGQKWQKLTKGLPKSTGRIGLDLCRKNPKVLYAVVESEEGGSADIRDDRSKAGGVFRSEDGGDTWVRQSVRSPRAFYFSTIRVDPEDDQKVHLIGWVHERSEDGGKTFRGGIGVKIHVDYHALIIDPADPSHMVAGTDGGVYQTFDDGKTWTFLNTMATGQFYNVTVDDSEPYRVMGGLQDNGTWLGPSSTDLESGTSSDGTINTGITNGDWRIVMWGDGFHAAFDPTDPNTIYAEWQGGNLVRVDLGRRYKHFIAPRPREGAPRFRFNWNTPFFVSPHDPKVLYMGGNYVFRLDDRGDKWDRISEDLTRHEVEKIETVGSTAETHATIVSLAESILTKGILWAGSDDGLIHVTRDGGKTWKNVTPEAVAGLYVAKIEPSRHVEGRAYAAIDGHRSDDMNPHILATDDFGKTWTDITGDLPKGWSVKCVREDHANPEVLYCGTENAMYATFDRGQTWHKINGKALPTTPVDDIVIHPRERDLVLGTHGRSIWILDDASMLSQLTPAVADSEAHLFAPMPARPRRKLTYGGLWTDQLFRAPNRPMGAIFNYWIREFEDEEVKIAVENDKGLEVISLTGSNAPGLNRVVWDLQPKEELRVANQGEEPDLQIFVPPGEYKVTLTYGKRKSTATLTVLPEA
jgi:photosystem II stability/assembly factor-like uncharacterized protein